MTGFAIIFLVLTAAALLVLPRSWAPLPLLVGACYMTLGQSMVIGPFHFPVIRILIFAGFVRVVTRAERPAGRLTGMDRVILAWAVWALLSSFFHKTPSDALVFRLGLVYNTLGIYFLIRTFCQGTEDMTQLIKITAFLLVPVALEMVNEHVTGRNWFAFLGGVPESVVVRDDRLRAQGPFSHGILAGTVGAVCLPLMIGIWRRHPLAAKIGLAACLVMVVTCNSSGPIMSVIFSVFALVLWRWRHFTRQMRIAAVIGYVLLDVVMKAPAYYLIARIDLTGSSTGYHRAALIQSSIKYLSEWWLAGTDYTRHWMPYGVPWSEDHCDITNQYLQYGVLSGLPLMVLFICVLWLAFRYVGQSLKLRDESAFEEQFLVWSLGAALFAHAASCISISYFDQSFLFMYLNLAMIGSLQAVSVPAESEVLDVAPRELSPLLTGELKRAEAHSLTAQNGSEG